MTSYMVAVELLYPKGDNDTNHDNSDADHDNDDSDDDFVLQVCCDCGSLHRGRCLWLGGFH